MANVVFISICDRNAYGQRLMSASLKQSGHQCHIVFLKRYSTTPVSAGEIEAGDHPWIGVDNRGRQFTYASGSPITGRELQLLRGVIERLRPDVIGMTVTTPLLRQNIRVSQFLKSFSKVPIIWGGFHPTVNPASCLDSCDYACAGEGDITILEVAQCIDRGDPLHRAPNLTYRQNGLPACSERAPLLRNLDCLPWRDDTPESKYFIEDDTLVENHAALNDRSPGSYQTLTSRGCPYRCSYCCEASMKDLYAGERFLRRRSPLDCVAELAATKARWGISEVVFEDEIFGVDLKWLEAFAPLYLERVGLPFAAYIYPARNVDKVLPLLQYAGLRRCCVGLQSGSARINKAVFNRVYERELFLKTVRLCKQLDVQLYTDVITHNPYEEECDLQDTLEVLLDMQGGFGLCVNKLFVLPGTPLAERMLADGKAAGETGRDRLFNYYCRLFWLATFSPCARWAVRLVQLVPVFRWFPALLNLGFARSFLRGPVGIRIELLQQSRTFKKLARRRPASPCITE